MGTVSRALLAAPLGFAIGLSLGALGGGGSILAVPALVYGAGEDPRSATTTSLVVVGATALAGMLGHWRAGRVRLGPGLAFGAAGIGGSYIGSLFNRLVPPPVLLLLFAGLMVVAAWRMWGRHEETPGSVRQASQALEPRSNWTPTRLARFHTVLRVVAAGTVVGLLTGFFGVGGGFVIVPALVLALGYAMPVAVGTSLLVIAVSSAEALGFRLQTSSIDWSIAGPFTVAGLLGVVTGDWIAGRVPAHRLTRGFVGLILAVAVYTAWQSILAFR